MSSPYPISQVIEGHARVVALLGGLSESDLRAPSALPGWSRGHVLAHLANNARGLTRQVEYARRGELVDMYDGGPAGRDADIETVAAKPAADLFDDVIKANEDLEKAWATMGPDEWARPVRFRDSTVSVTVYTRWREVEIHAVDLALDYQTTDWTAEFCDHAIGFLAKRLPTAVEVTLTSTDPEWQSVLGQGEPVEVRGALTDLTAWLAGRAHQGTMESSALPELGSWP